MKFPLDFYTELTTNTLTEVKGGTERESFLKIWMVEVDWRVFARSWNKSPNSWFTEFVKNGTGQIRYRDRIMKVSGRKLHVDDEIHKRINTAYLNKYDQENNLVYARGIIKPEYADYTMEFFFEEEKKPDL